MEIIYTSGSKVYINSISVGLLVELITKGNVKQINFGGSA